VGLPDLVRHAALREAAKGIFRVMLWPRIVKTRLRFWLFGIEAANEQLAAGSLGTLELLKHFGATIGSECVVHGPLKVHCSARTYSNLVIGNRVHVGRGVLLDLTDRLILEDESVISMNCTLLTHQDVGERLLSLRHPRRTGGLTIGRGVYLGASVVVLCGSNIGPGTTVGAGAVVTQPLPENVTAVGVPARIIKQHDKV
jgi:acetyltransferase-like isoleucine patch superfamily enzyme